MHRLPVGNDHPIEAELITQDGVQLLVGAHTHAVYKIIRSHHRPGFGLHRNLEGLQIELPESSFIHFRGQPVPGKFPVIAAIVLQRSAHMAFLHALNKGLAKHTGYIGVFRKIFKVSAAEGRSFNIHTGSQQNIHIVVDAIVSNGSAHLVGHLQIPGLGKHLIAGIGNGRVNAVIGPAVGDRQAAQTHRTVADFDLAKRAI